MNDANAGSDALLEGSALAALLGAGSGSFAMGFVVLLSEAGIFSPPALYAPAGGVTGRTTLAVVLWLAAWGTLHARWADRKLDPGRVVIWTLVLVAAGTILCFPPVWRMF